MRNQPAEMDAADFVTFFLKQKKKETDERKAKARREKPKSQSEIKKHMQIVVKNMSSSIYNQGWTMKQILSLSDEQLAHHYERMTRSDPSTTSAEGNVVDSFDAHISKKPRLIAGATPSEPIASDAQVIATESIPAEAIPSSSTDKGKGVLVEDSSPPTTQTKRQRVEEGLSE